jgi:hypothetical protein
LFEHRNYTSIENLLKEFFLKSCFKNFVYYVHFYWIFEMPKRKYDQVLNRKNGQGFCTVTHECKWKVPMTSGTSTKSFTYHF